MNDLARVIRALVREHGYPAVMTEVHRHSNRMSAREQFLYTEYVPDSDIRLAQHKLRRHGEITSEGCHLWTGPVDDEGYGRLRVYVCGRLSHLLDAHAVGYRVANGPIPRHLCVYHLFDSPDSRRCFNPAHLRLGIAIPGARPRITARSPYIGWRLVQTATGRSTIIDSTLDDVAERIHLSVHILNRLLRREIEDAKGWQIDTTVEIYQDVESLSA